MTAARASPTAPRERSRPPLPTRSVGNGRSSTFWEASCAPWVTEHALAVRPPAPQPVVADDMALARGPLAEFTRFLLTQWMAAFVTYEVLVATIDRKGRYLPTLGL